MSLSLPFDRRGFLKLAGLSWLTPVGELLAQQAEKTREPAQSVILLWLGGGPSQLETFDPHPDKKIAGGTKAIATAAKGIQLAEGFEQLAGQMGSVALIRSMVSKEGDHERGTYMMKRGYRPDPTVEHPSIGAICCHELPVGKTEIPRHISILSGKWPSRGGFLGAEFDPFQADDPKGALPDVTSGVNPARDTARLADLDILERTFAQGRKPKVDASQHRETLARARVMMGSEQLKAFDVSNEPASLRSEYGDSAFGRGCLAARRLIEVGVRCVEVTLDGWDAHVANHEVHRSKLKILDPAFAALLRDLKQRQLARAHHRRLLRRVRPHAQDQSGRRQRSLADRFQPRTRRRLDPRRHGPGRDRPRRYQRSRQADPGRRCARDSPGRLGPQPGQGKRRPGHQPTYQVERR